MSTTTSLNSWVQVKYLCHFTPHLTFPRCLPFIRCTHHSSNVTYISTIITGLRSRNLLTVFAPCLDCTKKAVIHRINNIKSKAKEAGLVDAVGTATTPKTPGKRGRKVKTEPDDDDNNASDESPTKKSKTTPAKAKAKAKAPIKPEPANGTKTEVKYENESDEESNN